MDRNYYYRILGLTEGATSRQVEAAYKERMTKLDSADYRDDPEYVAKKKRQTTEAYRVLTGSAAPVTKAQRRARFERFKDHIESREGGDDSGASAAKASKERSEHEGFHFGSLKSYIDRRGGAYQGAGGRASSKGKNLVAAAVLICSLIVIISIVFAILFAAMNSSDELGLTTDKHDASSDRYDLSSDDAYDEFTYGYEHENEAAIDEAQIDIAGADYYAGLDLSAMDENAYDIDWDYGIGVYGGSEENDILSSISNIMSSREIYGINDFFAYITGDEDYFIRHDDFACATAMIDWMRAPGFEDIAGSINLYSGEPILDLADYLKYLESVADENI